MRDWRNQWRRTCWSGRQRQKESEDRDQQWGCDYWWQDQIGKCREKTSVKLGISGSVKILWPLISQFQFTSVVQLCLTLCDPVDCSTQGFPVHHQLPESTQTHVHWVGDAIQPSHLLSSPSPPAFNLSQHQGFFQMSQFFASGGQILKLQHQSFQWIFRTDFL